jgi:hypothetical protein
MSFCSCSLFPHGGSRYPLTGRTLPLLRLRVRSRSFVRCTTSWQWLSNWLGQVQAVASKMISLTCKAKEPPLTRSTLDSISEGSWSDEAQDDLGVFGADDIQAFLRRVNYKTNFILFGVRVLSVRECDIRGSQTCRFTRRF